MSSVIKKRFWWFLIYPESCIPDWLESLKMHGLPIAVSPLHQYDLLNEEGEIKKPHYHVILCYPGPTTFNNVKTLTVDELQGTIPKAIDSVKGAYDYLTHKNDKDKFQYNEDEIQLYNGFDIFELVQLSEKDKADLKIQVIRDIIINDFKEYSDIVNYYMTNNDYQLFNLVSNHTIFFNRYISSRRHSKEKLVSDESYAKRGEEK